MFLFARSLFECIGFLKVSDKLNLIYIPHSRVTEPWCCLPVLLLRSLGLLLWCSWADLWAGGGCGPAMEADPASIASSARGTRNS